MFEPSPHAGAGPAALARRGDFTLGRARISPATRTVTGPGGTAKIEPMVMQVLLALTDAGGKVLTRDDLIDACWGGRFVGDDAVNRVIGEVRRAARGAGAESFAVETIPKTGWRLVVEGDRISPPPRVSRRRAVAGLAGTAGALAVGGMLVWPRRAESLDPRAADRLERARRIMRGGVPGTAPQAAALLQQAAAIAPDNAAIWGSLALAWRDTSEFAPPGRTADAVAACEAAANRALAIDPRNGDALAALALLRPTLGDWLAGERRLRSVLAVAPDNIAALGGLDVLMMAVGRCRLALRFNDRLVALEPLAPIFQDHRGFKLWTAGRLAEADQTLDRALRLWPQNPGVWYARMLVFAVTGRAGAALRMVEDREGQPPGMSDQLRHLLRVSLTALITGAPADVRASVDANMAAARDDPGSAVTAINFLARMGELDAAFTVANGYLLRRGPLVGGLRADKGLALNDPGDQRWRQTMMLFTPVAADMRADARFLPLCRDIGLVDYWRESGTRPDYLVRQA